MLLFNAEISSQLTTYMYIILLTATFHVSLGGYLYIASSVLFIPERHGY